MTTQTAQSNLVRMSKTIEQIYGKNFEGTPSCIKEYSQNMRGIAAEETTYSESMKGI